MTRIYGEKMNKEVAKKLLSFAMIACMVTGAAATTAYIIKQYSVTMDVNEAIQAQYNGPGGWTELPTESGITTEIMPGETNTQELKVKNLAPNGVLGVVITATPGTESDPYLSWNAECGTGDDTAEMKYKVDGDSVKVDVPAGKTYIIKLNTLADGATPEDITLTFDTSLGRQNPFGDSELTSTCTT